MIVLINSFEDKGNAWDDATAFVYLDTTRATWPAVERTYVITRDSDGNEIAGSGWQTYIEWVPNPPGWLPVGGSDGLQWKKAIDGKWWFVERMQAAPFYIAYDVEDVDCDINITEVLTQNATAETAPDGQATVTATSGFTAIQYSIDGGTSWQSSNVFAELLPGDYTALAKDDAGCTDTFDFTVAFDVPPPDPTPTDPADIMEYEGLNIQIGNDMVDVPPGMDVAVNIKYQREDGEDFQKKRSSEALNVTLPATLWNQRDSNFGEQPGLLDMTQNQTFESHRPAVIRHKGFELLVGKAFLQRATYKTGPQAYEYSFYGNNADWVIDHQDTTLLDLCRHIFYPNTLETVMDSWQFDGRNEALPYVFAPARYANVFGEDDTNCTWEDLRPALSKWFILYWGFKKLGYRVQSNFCNTDYFRRQVMPWTWGNYLKSEGLKQDNLDFLAINEQSHQITDVDPEREYVPMKLYLGNDNTLGAFDNNGVYAMDNTGAGQGTWTYLPAYNYGPIEATFYLRMVSSGRVTSGGNVNIRFDYYVNGLKVAEAPMFYKDSDYAIGNTNNTWAGETFEQWTTINVVPGDVVSVKLMVRGNVFSTWRVSYSRIEWAFEYFRITDGGIITFEDFNGLQKYKFIDFLRGVVDEFNLDIETDSVNKVVLVEPAHNYSITEHLKDNYGMGYFNGKALDWTDREDIDAPGEVALFSYIEQNLAFSYAEDSSDGVAKTLLARNNVAPGTGRYVFPARFKKGKKEYKNRFFSPSIHYFHTAWAGISMETPQLMAFIPENIGDTSAKDSACQFAPRSAYYKGIVPGIGWRFEGEERGSFPFMFAVNYLAGGEGDPVLSYSDELIGEKIGYGLLKRFFWQRLANLRAGKFLTAHFRLTERDVQNWFHREHIILNNLRFELRSLDYRPLTGESTECELRMFSPVSLVDHNNTFPSENTLRGLPPVSGYDTRYVPLIALQSDIPQ